MSGLSESFESPVALFFISVANLLCGWILLTTGNFTWDMKEKPSMHDCNRCYGINDNPVHILWYTLPLQKFPVYT